MTSKSKIIKLSTLLLCCILLVNSCGNPPSRWKGPRLKESRDQLTVDQLLKGDSPDFLDMSYFSRPEWAQKALIPFSGSISFVDTELMYPKEKAFYPGENIFPKIRVDFISNQGELIPRVREKVITRHQSDSYWDVIVGTGKTWHDKEDGEWNRASFPLTLTDRWVGQARNCVATFVYKTDSISHVCLQCSQETADMDDRQLGNMKGILPVSFQRKQFADSTQIIEQYRLSESKRLPTYPLSDIDADHAIADYFERMIYTNAPTSLGAVWMNEKLYLHPPQTRHGPYPYPNDMRHGLYSVTKSMAGALALMYLEERYEEDVFDARIADYVPALADHEGWRGVTFGQTLNMVTGTVGGEDAERLFSTLIAAETAEEAIRNIAKLGDAPEAPGEKFNYASTNLFVLSYAMQQYVEAKEDQKVNYWDLVRENVLVPIGAEHFSLLHTIEPDDTNAIPILAYGALPTIDEAAKIALLFANRGNYQGRQLLNKERTREVFGETDWKGYTTNNDFRGTGYRHSFWSKEIRIKQRTITATYMLGFGENYVVFLPGNTIIFRFLDEHDLDIDELIKRVEGCRSDLM